MNTKFLLISAAVLALFSCVKTSTPGPGPTFELSVNNEYNQLQGRFAIFVSEPDGGKLRAFSWAPGEDTLLMQVAGSSPEDLFDCTVAQISTLVAPGTGVRDTFLTLTTYTGLSSGAKINLRTQVYQQATSLKFTLTGMNSLDSVVVPDSYAIQKPQASNNYAGEYFCYHTGKCWMRVLVNGDPFWKFVRFDHISGSTVDASDLNTNIFTTILAPPISLNFPFVAPWDFKVDGVVDTSKLEFFPLSQPIIPPGSFVPNIDHANIFEPVNNDQFDPNRPYQGFRLRARGAEPSVDGYTYIIDHFYDAIPATLPTPGFDLQPTILADNRLIAVQCSGDFDLLSFSRSYAGPGHDGALYLTWEVLTKPVHGIASYRLPDVPDELGSLYGPLKNYAFSGKVHARAEAYDASLTYDQIIRKLLSASDPIWQAKAGYLGREEEF